MFLKLDTYFLPSNTKASIKLFNGTFDKSENVITRDRMTDVSLVGNGTRTQMDTTHWTEKNEMTILNITTGETGTWVAGVSTRPRNIEMAAADFNNYLDHDGVLDMLTWRKENNVLDQDAIEKYSKHVKAIYQIGDKRTDDWKTTLGYPIEFVPLSNPYLLRKGDDLKVKLLLQGKPLPNQLIYVGSSEAHGHSHSHDHEHEHEHNEDGYHHDHAGAQFLTDAQGELTVNIDKEGTWYLRTIHMIQTEEVGLTHESNWATLTFEVGHSHGDGSHTHAHNDHGHSHENNHDHQHEGGIPSYAYWIASLALIVGLFFWFNRKAE